MDGDAQDILDQNYHNLLDKLRLNAAAYRKKPETGDRLAACAGALFAVVQFLERLDPRFRDENLTTPLGALACAALEVTFGWTPSLFQVEKASNRHGSFARDLLKATVMVAVDVLLKAGINHAEANRIVSEELNRAGRPTDAKQIKGWRKDWGRASSYAHESRLTLGHHPYLQQPTAHRGEAVRRATEIIRIGIAGLI